LAAISTSCFILGFYIFLKDRSSRINRLFFVNSMLLNAVILFTILIQLQETALNVKLFQSIYNIVLILFLLESLYFNLEFTRQKLKHFVVVSIILFSGIIFAVFILRGPEMLEVSRVKGLWVYELVGTRFWFLLYSPYLTCIALLMLYYLFMFSRSASLQKEKKQAKTVMIAIFLSYGGGFCFLMILPVLKIYKAPLLTPYFFAVYLYGVFFAMIKYKFLSFSIRDMAFDILPFIHDSIIILSPEKRILEVNGGSDGIFNGRAGYFSGKNFLELVEHDDGLPAMLDELISGRIDSFSARIIYRKEPENVITDSYISRVSDRFGDFAAILVVSRENKGVSQFRKYFKITGREMEIIFLILSGLTNKSVSAQLKITERTVETHLTNIYGKLGIGNKIELAKISGDFSIRPLKEL
jgi:DNA-binding CsgD family transcriptional regulator